MVSSAGDVAGCRHCCYWCGPLHPEPATPFQQQHPSLHCHQRRHMTGSAGSCRHGAEVICNICNQLLVTPPYPLYSGLCCPHHLTTTVLSATLSCGLPAQQPHWCAAVHPYRLQSIQAAAQVSRWWAGEVTASQNLLTGHSLSSTQKHWRFLLL